MVADKSALGATHTINGSIQALSNIEEAGGERRRPKLQIAKEDDNLANDDDGMQEAAAALYAISD